MYTHDTHARIKATDGSRVRISPLLSDAAVLPPVGLTRVRRRKASAPHPLESTREKIRVKYTYLRRYRTYGINADEGRRCAKKMRRRRGGARGRRKKTPLLRMDASSRVPAKTAAVRGCEWKNGARRGEGRGG